MEFDSQMLLNSPALVARIALNYVDDTEDSDSDSEHQRDSNSDSDSDSDSD